MSQMVTESDPPQSLKPVDIPPGYKFTEVGVIPKEWSTRQIGDFCMTYTGGTPLTSQSDYYGGNIPWITSGDLNARRITDVAGRITQKGFDSSATKMVKRGDLLIALYGATAGVIAVTEIDAAINQAVLAISTEICDKEYLFQHLASRKNQIVETYTQGGQPNLSGEIIRSLIVAIPPLPEQRAIAAALSDADGLIGALDATIEKKRAIKQAAMQQLLAGKKRLLGFEGEWEAKRIGDILKVHHGRSQRDIAVSDGKYPILASGGEIGRTDTALFYKPSVLIGRKGTIDEPQYISSPFWTVDTLFYTEINEKNVAKFVFYKFCMISWRNYNEASGVPSLNAKTIENIEITTPGCDEQTAIAAVLSDMDAEIAALERRREKAKQIKQSMMQQLLTGRIRLVEPPGAAA